VSNQHPTIELADIQALVRFGFKHLTQASFLLLRIENREAARTWLASAPVTDASDASPLPTTALQIALTSEGMRALGVAPDIINGFSHEFIVGMSADTNRSARLGDVQANAPDKWSWGAADGVPHVVVMLYTTPQTHDSYEQAIGAQLSEGFKTLKCLRTSELSSREPFGFEDGISQPTLDWKRERPVRDEEQLAYTNLACLGEFLLGYPNEYGMYTDRPLVDPLRGNTSALPLAEDAPEQADVGRNGSYLVMRQLQQDVQGFRNYLDRQSHGNKDVSEQLAAAMVGRTREGEPVVGRSSEVIAGLSPKDDINAFTYQSDPQGIRCPLGAHIRRSNPRNADLPPGKTDILSRLKRTLGFDANALANDLVASTRFHRLLRRGRKYGMTATAGSSVSQQDAIAAAPIETGIHFISLVANISRQFEFVQGAWIAGTRFAGLRNESDPLLGNRQSEIGGSPSDVFSIPQSDGPDRKLTDLPSFVTVRGGAYFFLPGIRALRYLVSAGSESAGNR
jgi:deferrochelatase/peroxidase EfeB